MIQCVQGLFVLKKNNNNNKFYSAFSQVLPFDDNLCLIEPCVDFKSCQSIVDVGEARPFISSDTILFRPIHPEYGYRCPCPHGFAGWWEFLNGRS